MRPAEISNESIIEAGVALQASGRNITGFALRQRIGAGNPSRLKQVWDEHITSHAAVPPEPVAELPIEVAEAMAAEGKELVDRLARLAVDLNDKAVKAAERRVTEIVRSAGEQREQAERELADAAQTVDELESRLEERTVAFDALESKLAETIASNQAQAVELAQLRERLAHAEHAASQHAAEVGRVRAEADRLRGDFDQTRAELVKIKAKAEAADEAHQEQRKQAAAEVHRATERMTKAEGERDTARLEGRRSEQAALDRAARAEGQIEALQTHVAQLMARLSPQGDRAPGKG